MIIVKNADFCIEQIADSGQCFRINKSLYYNNDDSKSWDIYAFNKILKIKKLDNNTHIFYCNKDDYKNIWEDYFDLKRDYNIIKKEILKLNDTYLNNAINYGYGIRILNQDIYEVIISFIISQRNNIKRIKNIIEKLCSRHNGSFPTYHELANYSIDDLKNIGLGYRADYILNISNSIKQKIFDIEHLKKLNYQDSINYLKRFKGIGDKVANCISLFGLGKIESFPKDIWINKIIDKYYNGNLDISKFKDYAGIVQQYMFYYERNNKFYSK